MRPICTVVGEAIEDHYAYTLEDDNGKRYLETESALKLAPEEEVEMTDDDLNASKGARAVASALGLDDSATNGDIVQAINALDGKVAEAEAATKAAKDGADTANDEALDARLDSAGVLPDLKGMVKGAIDKGDHANWGEAVAAFKADKPSAFAKEGAPILTEVAPEAPKAPGAKRPLPKTELEPIQGALPSQLAPAKLPESQADNSNMNASRNSARRLN